MNIKKAVKKICKEYKVENIDVKFTNRTLGGRAFYTTEKYKGLKTSFPVNITIGEWEGIKNHPDEIAYVLGHELAHHVNNILNHSLKHDAKFKKLWNEIENKLEKLIK